MWALNAVTDVVIRDRKGDDAEGRPGGGGGRHGVTRPQAKETTFLEAWSQQKLGEHGGSSPRAFAGGAAPPTS